MSTRQTTRAHDHLEHAGDALTAIPLGLAFWLRSRRGERWAGHTVVAVIWRADRRLDSPALTADGDHAGADGIVSAGVILSTLLIAVGFPLADPLIAVAISGLVSRSTWDSWRTIRAS